MTSRWSAAPCATCCSGERRASSTWSWRSDAPGLARELGDARLDARHPDRCTSASAPPPSSGCTGASTSPSAAPSLPRAGRAAGGAPRQRRGGPRPPRLHRQRDRRPPGGARAGRELAAPSTRSRICAAGACGCCTSAASSTTPPACCGSRATARGWASRSSRTPPSWPAQALAAGALDTVSGGARRRRAAARAARSRRRRRARRPRRARRAAGACIRASIVPGGGRVGEPRLRLDAPLARRALALLPADGRPDLLLWPRCCSCPRQATAGTRTRRCTSCSTGSSSLPPSASGSCAPCGAAPALVAAIADAAAPSQLHDALVRAHARGGRARGRAQRARARERQRRGGRLARAAAPRAPAINGDDLLAAGIAAGPEIGMRLDAALAAQARRRARRRARRGAARGAGGDRVPPGTMRGGCESRCRPLSSAAEDSTGSSARAARRRARAVHDARRRQPLDRQRRRARARHAPARAALRAPRPALAVREPPGARDRRERRSSARQQRRAGARDRRRRPGDRPARGRRDGAGRRLPAGRARLQAAPSRCVHAGWRGLAAGVLEEGVSALRELAGATAAIGAIVGPGAGACCYEVGAEVHAAFGDGALATSAAASPASSLERDRQGTRLAVRPSRPARDRARAPARRRRRRRSPR